MMRNSEITRQNVLKEAIELFNTKGYKSTSLNDIVNATGYTKGAIYCHFENKDALEIEAFENMMEAVFSIMSDKIKSKANTRDKLFSILNFFNNYVTHPYIKGGCPLLNAAIEVDDTSHPLKQKAQKALALLRASIIKIIENGKKNQQVKESVDQNIFATMLIASLEGGIMMSKLQNDNADISAIVAYLKSWIDSQILC